jgi:hypothetical protein
MISSSFIAVLAVCLTAAACGQTDTDQPVFSSLTGPYLGQEPPGMIPEMFAPDVLTVGGHETSISFSPDGLSFCYTLTSGGDRLLAEPKGPFRKLLMMHSYVEDGRWTEPGELPLAPHRIARYPNFSPDGTKLFFNARPGGGSANDPAATDMWYAESRGREWSEPQQIVFSPEFTGRRVGVYPTVASNGNLYFATFADGQNGDIHVSRYQNGSYSDPESLTEELQNHGNHPYIAPDESFLLFDWELEGENSENHGENDILISFRDGDGNWMPAQNLGARVNTVYHDWRPFVSFDGKYLFFSSNRIADPDFPSEPVTLTELRSLTDVPADGYQHLYWVDARVIEEIRPKLPG